MRKKKRFVIKHKSFVTLFNESYFSSKIYSFEIAKMVRYQIKTGMHYMWHASLLKLLWKMNYLITFSMFVVPSEKTVLIMFIPLCSWLICLPSSV